MTDLRRFGFDFTDEQRDVREMMLRFAEDRLAPGAAARDQDHPDQGPRDRACLRLDLLAPDRDQGPEPAPFVHLSHRHHNLQE